MALPFIALTIRRRPITDRHSGWPEQALILSEAYSLNEFQIIQSLDWDGTFYLVRCLNRERDLAGSARSIESAIVPGRSDLRR